MKKMFETSYNGRRIVVENHWLEGEKLYVDGKLIDKNPELNVKGFLYGKMNSMDGTLGGFFAIQCKVFVDNDLIYSSAH